MAGETRCVRPPLPWRPSKLRLLVEAQRSPGSSLSGFIARHMLQPASRHSKPGLREDPVEPLGLGLPLDLAAAGHDHRADALGDVIAADHGRGGPQVFDPAVGAGADEHAIDRDRRRSACRASGPCTPARAATVLRSVSIGEFGRVGHLAADRRDLAGIGAPGDLRRDVGGVEDLDAVVLRAGIGGQLLPAGDGGVEILAGRTARPRR